MYGVMRGETKRENEKGAISLWLGVYLASSSRDVESSREVKILFGITTTVHWLDRRSLICIQCAVVVAENGARTCVRPVEIFETFEVRCRSLLTSPAPFATRTAYYYYYYYERRC